MSNHSPENEPEKAQSGAPARPKTVPINRVRIAGYTILREIGQGGMSIVYLAEQKSLKREVAIKVLKKNVANDPEVASRFLHEAKIIAKLDHPHIVSIYEVGHTEDGDPYYSMPYLRYGDLSQASFKFDKDIKHLMAGVCEGLAYSHEHEVIHRDLKPANILFDHFGNAQVADFGIALSRNSKRWTKQEHIIGSACYMSPEQALSKPVTQASDLYSLGTILYEQLTGSPPFVKDDDLSTLVAHINEPVPRLPPEKAHWQPVIDKALAKHPEDRFFNALEFKNAVAQVSPGVFHALKDTLRRVNRKTGIAVATVLALSALLLVFWPDKPAPEASARPVNGNQGTLASAAEKIPAAPIQAEDDTPASQLDQLELDESAPAAAVTETPLTASTDAPESNSPTESGSPNPVPALEASALANDSPQGARPPRAEDILSGLGAEQLTPAQATTLISAGFQKIKEKRLTRPEGDNAFAYFTEVLNSFPGNQRATQGLQLVFNYYLEKTRQALASGQYAKAGKYAEKLQDLYHRSGLVSTSQALRKELLQTAEDRIAKHRSNYRPEPASTVVQIVSMALPDAKEAIANLNATAKQIPRAGQWLRDKAGQDTIFIPGSGNDGLAAFGLMPNEVTVADYARFAKATGRQPARCQHKAAFKPFSSKTWKKPPFKQTAQNPVVCVTWDDAAAYAQWLSKRSGHHYALPSVAQWQSLKRWQTAGASPCQKGNVAGRETGALRVNGKPWSCRDKHVFTAAVGLYGKNSLGIADIWGNTAEWLAGCGKAPADAGKKWLKKLKLVKDKGCPRRYAGNSWLDGAPHGPMEVSTALPGHAFTHVGFRLVRSLD